MIDLPFQHRRVEVAKFENLLLGKAFGDQLLFHLDHIVVGHAAQQVGKLLFHRFGRPAFMQLQDHMFEDSRFFRVLSISSLMGDSILWFSF
jgi:hypothetical protein